MQLIGAEHWRNRAHRTGDHVVPSGTGSGPIHPGVWGAPGVSSPESPALTLPSAIPRWLHSAATLPSAAEIAAGSCRFGAPSNLVAPASVRFPECSPTPILAFGTATDTLVGVQVAETDPHSACPPDEGLDDHVATPAPKRVTSATPPSRRRFRKVMHSRATFHRCGPRSWRSEAPLSGACRREIPSQHLGQPSFELYLVHE